MSKPMSTPNPAVDESIIECNQSEAKKHLAAAELDSLTAQRIRLQDKIDAVADARNGHFVFSTEMNEPSLYELTYKLRCHRRLFQDMPLVVEMNSPGGLIVEGLGAIDEIERLKQEGMHLTIRVRGEACSMAAVLLQSATVREIGRSSHLMLHRASFGVADSADKVEDQLETTKMFESRIYEILAERSDKTPGFWKSKLGKRKDVYFTAPQALEVGLVDSIN